MRRQLSLLIGYLPLATALLAGCSPQQPFYFHPDKNADLSHYVSMTTEMEYPDLKELPTVKPRTPAGRFPWPIPKPRKSGT